MKVRQRKQKLQITFHKKEVRSGQREAKAIFLSFKQNCLPILVISLDVHNRIGEHLIICAEGK